MMSIFTPVFNAFSDVLSCNTAFAFQDVLHASMCSSRTRQHLCVKVYGPDGIKQYIYFVCGIKLDLDLKPFD